jgi:hypothetical protein
MATAIQFASSRCRELFSFSTHFLHFVGRQNGHASKAFSAFFSAKKGERYFTCAVHRVLHPNVHPVGLITGLQSKHLAMPKRAFWTWRGRGVGWNDPAFCRTVCPKGFSEVVPAHSRGRKVSTMQMSAISIP